jgi:hypothetical protein
LAGGSLGLVASMRYGAAGAALAGKSVGLVASIGLVGSPGTGAGGDGDEDGAPIQTPPPKSRRTKSPSTRASPPPLTRTPPFGISTNQELRTSLTGATSAPLGGQSTSAVGLARPHISGVQQPCGENCEGYGDATPFHISVSDAPHVGNAPHVRLVHRVFLVSGAAPRTEFNDVELRSISAFALGAKTIIWTNSLGFQAPIGIANVVVAPVHLLLQPESVELRLLRNDPVRQLENAIGIAAVSRLGGAFAALNIIPRPNFAYPPGESLTISTYVADTFDSEADISVHQTHTKKRLRVRAWPGFVQCNGDKQYAQSLAKVLWSSGCKTEQAELRELAKFTRRTDGTGEMINLLPPHCMCPLPPSLTREKQLGGVLLDFHVRTFAQINGDSEVLAVTVWPQWPRNLAAAVNEYVGTWEDCRGYREKADVHNLLCLKLRGYANKLSELMCEETAFAVAATASSSLRQKAVMRVATMRNIDDFAMALLIHAMKFIDGEALPFSFLQRLFGLTSVRKERVFALEGHLASTWAPCR